MRKRTVVTFAAGQHGLRCGATPGSFPANTREEKPCLLARSISLIVWAASP
jgi:hypothetical protein